MIVVEPPAARFESAEGAASTDEHLLERISALENRMSRLTEKLERGLDLLLRQAQNSFFDRALIKALIAHLTEDGLLQSERLERLWNDCCQRDAAEQDESSRREELRLRILAASANGQNREFERLVNEGFLLLKDKQLDRGLQRLKRASDALPGNAALLSFLGEHYFKDGKSRLAKHYLEKAHADAPNDARLSLLLGLACADAGDRELAKQLLSATNRLAGPSFAAHYGLGRLFAAEENWRQALREFKRALSSKPSPEAHYVLACLYYQLSRDSLALRHLRKAVEMDETYGEAFHLLGLIYRRNGQEELARQAFESAAACDIVSHSAKDLARTTPAPLFAVSQTKSRKLLTGGDRRLAKALREEALKAFATQGN
jgi:tetratricopeptide (TPR) repeat protein